MEKKVLPAFASEAEEANWWFENREKHAEDFIQAFERGEVRQGGLAQRLGASRTPTQLTLTLEDSLKARTLAEKKGIEVQLLLHNLLSQAYDKEVIDAA